MAILKSLKKKFLTILISMFLVNTIFSQETITDTISQNFDTQEEDAYNNRIVDEMDSLLNIWYINKSMNLTENLYKMNISSTEPISYSDSVYALRLSQIPSIVPLSYNKEVRGFIERYCVRGRRSAGVLVGLSQYYFPIYEEIMDKYGVPQELKYLSVIESALNPMAVSPVGATGLWQFMFATGRQYGLDVNTFIDDRKDLIKSTHAAAKHLNDLYNIYKDWILAIAAYNCGAGNVNKALRRANGKTNFWDIYRYLPKETRGYVPAYIAATYMMNYWDKHNIVPIKIEMPLITDTVIVNKELHFQQLSAVLNIPIEQIRTLNPQYKRDIVPAYNQSYNLILPPNKAIEFNSLRDSIHNFNYLTYFTPLQVINIQTVKNHSDKKFSKLKKKVHIVKKGETLKSLSDKYGLAESEIRYMNRLKRKSNYLPAGRKLFVGYEPKETKIENKELKVDNKINSPTITPQQTEKVKQDNVEYIFYKVNKGDTMYSISKKFEGITLEEILKHNENIKDNKITPGQIIKIPKS